MIKTGSVFVSVFITAMLALGGINAAHAEVAPKRGTADARVRTVIYNSSNVVGVDATYGVSTMIVLGDAEKIETVAVGDSISWKIEPNKKATSFFSNRWNPRRPPT